MADINDWMRGNGTDALRGNTNASLINDYVTAYLQAPLDLLLTGYRKNCEVRYTSSKTVTIAPGKVAVQNLAEDTRRFRANTSEIILTMPDVGSTGAQLDNGGITAATGYYYVYAIGDSESDTEFTGMISSSATFPSGNTYAQKIGYFYYDTTDDATGVVCSVGNIGIPNKVAVVGTDTQTVSTNYADLADMTIYFVSTGTRPVTMRFSAAMGGAGSHDEAFPYVKILANSVLKGGTYGYINASEANDGGAWSTMCEWTGVLTAGPYTIQVQWKSSYGTAYQYGALYPRTLVVEE